jgi:sugar phosphate isomerase/epimerase
MIEERQRNGREYFECALKSIQELAVHAKRCGIALAIENRYYHREIPSFDEFAEIFDIFSKKDLFYWHDVGHAAVFERLGFFRQEDMLEKFQNRLIGIHLHDIIGPMNDHRPPGRGSVDFSLFKRYIGKNVLKVIEAHQPSTARDITDSVQYLKRFLGE